MRLAWFFFKDFILNTSEEYIFLASSSLHWDWDLRGKIETFKFCLPDTMRYFASIIPIEQIEQTNLARLHS